MMTLGRIENIIILLSILAGSLLHWADAFAQQKDSTIHLDNVTILDSRTPSDFKSSLPVQTLTRNILQHLDISSVGDAARYFSGVLIKDYGGVGGLKTVSVRGLGSANAGILYDGIPISDVQSGQIDLSKFSSLFVSSISVYQGEPKGDLLPARIYSYASIIDIRTISTFGIKDLEPQLKAGLETGSFGLWQPSLGISASMGKRSGLNVAATYLHSKGDYPYTLRNGNTTERMKRENSRTDALQGEINFYHQLKDSSVFTFKSGIYDNERGLPGVVIFFNPHSSQKLWNRDVFVQSQYLKQFLKGYDVLISAKYQNAYTRYKDPDFQNGVGGINDTYRNDEWYISAVLKKEFTNHFSASFANDYTYAALSSNKKQFAFPKRNQLWNALTMQYSRSNWQLKGTLLHSFLNDKTKIIRNNVQKDRLTPSVIFSYTPHEIPSLFFRAFYKQVFRMPTFNDLYYNLIGNRNLKPESASQYNLGATWMTQYPNSKGSLNLSLDGYFNRVRDKIVAYPNQNLFIWSMLNVGKVNIGGIDFNGESNFKLSETWYLFTRIAYTFQHAIDVSNKNSAAYKNRIPYTPDQSGSGVFLFTHGQWTIGYSLLFSGIRYALGANDPTNKLDGWATHDFSVAKEVKYKYSKITLRAAVNNFTDKRYDVVRFYPMPGRNFRLIMNYQLRIKN